MISRKVTERFTEVMHELRTEKKNEKVSVGKLKRERPFRRMHM